MAKIKLKDIVYSGRSKIHGNGLFAKQKIKKGSYIGTYKGPETTDNDTYVLWVYENGEDKDPIGRDGRNILRYLNHKKKCNAEFDGFDLYAIKTISPDDEITFDYGWDE